MEKSRACMLVGEGAAQFAKDEGFTSTPTYDLVTESSIISYEKFSCNPECADTEFELVCFISKARFKELLKIFFLFY